MEDRVEVKGDEIVLTAASGGAYHVPKDRCDTPEKLLGWIYHLCEKGWVTRTHVRHLIYHAKEDWGVEVDIHC